jgi:glucose-1-phosphate cytidylyltransferase
MAVRPHLEGEEMFLANYSDGLTDLPLPEQIAHFEASGKIASFVSVRPNLSYHFVSAGDDGVVTDIQDIVQCGLRVNGGYFVFRKEIFDYMQPGEELVLEPFERLVHERQLLAYRYDGFWIPMDTAKDKKRVDELYESGNPPWFVWRNAVPHRSLSLVDHRIQVFSAPPAAALG